MINTKKNIQIAKKWLLYSGIQNTDKKKNLYGSFNSWFDIKKNRFSFAYSEITGYGINTLLYLHSKEKKLNDVFIKRAKIGADWLIDKAYNQNIGGIICRYDHVTEKANDKICVFDNGMCLNALTNLFRITGENKYLDYAIKIANWLLKMQKVNGSFYPRYLLGVKKLEEDDHKWSKQSGSFHAKLAIGLLNLNLVTGEKKYLDATKRICDWTLRFQTNEGRFITESGTQSTFLHPNCYTLEGLLVAGIIMHNNTYIKAVKKAMRWILKNKLETNGFPAYFINNNCIPVESPEINAQVLRLIIILNEIGEAKADKKGLALAIHHILNYQSTLEKQTTLGGFYPGDALFYKKQNLAKTHVNSWVTMFIIQALLMYQQGFRKEDIFYMV